MSLSYSRIVLILCLCSIVEAQELKISYYDLTAQTAQEALRRLATNGITDSHGVIRHARATWHLSWRWPKDERGEAILNQAKVSCRAEILFPRWSGYLIANHGDQRLWRDYIQRVAQHEWRHVMNGCSGASKIEGLIRKKAKNFSEANLIAELELVRLRQIDRNYDTVTNHGESEGIVPVNFRAQEESIS